MRTVLTSIGVLLVTCAAVVVASGCGSTPAVTTTVVSETTITAVPPDPHADDWYTSASDLATDIKKDSGDVDLSGLVCSPTPAFEGDASRWECVPNSGIRIEVSVDQNEGSFTWTQK